MGGPCRRMVAALDPDEMTFKIGTSKIIFKLDVWLSLRNAIHTSLQDVRQAASGRPYVDCKKTDEEDPQSCGGC